MRIFYMCNTLDVGGTESQLVAAAAGLRARGYSVSVGCFRAQGAYAPVLERSGVSVREFWPGGSMMHPRFLYAVGTLARHLRRTRVDVFHTHDLYSNLFGIPAAALARVPCIISSRRDLGDWWWYTKRNRRILRHIQSLSHTVVANSAAVKRQLVEQDGFSSSKVRVIYNAVDRERFRPARERRQGWAPGTEGVSRIVMLANMHVRTKGHSILIEAAREVCRKLPRARFLLVGDGVLRPELEALVSQYGLSDEVLFLGVREDVPELLASAEVGVLASVAEGLPNAVLEYMAAGLPVVASAVGGVPELVAHETSGILVPPREPAALAAALVRVLEDRTLAASMGQAGLARATSLFSFERLLGELESLYQAGLRSRQPGSAPCAQESDNSLAEMRR